MSIISSETISHFQTNNFFSYPTYWPDITHKRSNSIGIKYVSTSKQQKIENKDYLVTFSPETKSYCIGMVDMVNSTKKSTILGSKKMSRYYQIFLNSMSKIINEFDGKVVKNMGDCLLYYFPSLGNETHDEYLIRCLECNFVMIESHDFICRQLKKEKLPCLDYRISIDYGNVILMKSGDSTSVDMIGTPINMCSKINRNAPPNQIVIGGDIHEMIKKDHRYEFKQIDDYSVGLKFDYPIYVTMRNDKHTSNI